jgi:hypothetical protein
VVIHADSAEILQRWLPAIRADVADIGPAYAKIHPRAASRLSADELARFAPDDPLWGPAAPKVEVTENAVH